MSTRLEEYNHAPTASGVMTYSGNWYLLKVSETLHQLLIEQVEATGETIEQSHKPHISVIKKEAPFQNKQDWGIAFVDDEFDFQYSSTIRNDNGYHLWIDCYSPALCKVREHFGLPTLKTSDGIYLVNFHITIGKREVPTTPNIREHYRLTLQSHIDAETGMQHL